MPEKSSVRRVLVVDDEPLIRWSLNQVLSARGLHVSEAGDGASARHLLLRTPAYDVVLLDLRLPDVDDLRLVSEVRALAPHARVILMTAFGTPEVLAQAEALGVAALVHKPFEVSAVADLVTAAQP